MVARLHVEARYDEATVIAEATALLIDRFSFKRMRLGEAITASAIVSLLQSVRGVVGVDLDLLHKSSEPAGTSSRLPARGGYVDRSGAVFPAELLTLNITALALTAVLAPTTGA